MTSFTARTPLTSNEQESARDLCTALETALGRRFSIWQQQNGWRLWSASSHAAVDSPPGAEEIQRGLEQLVDPKASTVQQLSDGRQLLLVPLVQHRQRQVVVAGIVDACPTALLLSLADMTLAYHVLQRESAVDRRRINRYLNQITADFEELTWLRNISQHFEFCDLRKDLVDVAQTTLPSLRHLICAEAIFLFDMPEERETADENQPAGSLLVCDSNGNVSEAAARQAIGEMHRQCGRQGLVRNRAAEPDDFFADTPAVRKCILVRVTKGDEQLGWLLAVNKNLTVQTAEEAAEQASSRREAEFGTFEAGLVATMGAMLATHGRNVQLLREKEALLIGVIRALINSMDAKDTYTCGHSDRVAAIAERLGQQLGLSEVECRQVYVAGLLHDIGKVGVPDAVLGKPGKLTDEEFRVIQTHPAVGVEILKHLEPLNYVVKAVLHHHEAFNGSGYPHGIAGEAIPLFSRIIAVADSYDAMTSDRPYRGRMPAEQAENILRAGAGQQWDAGVVEAFFAVLDEARSICQIGVPGRTNRAVTFNGLLPCHVAAAASGV